MNNLSELRSSMYHEEAPILTGFAEVVDGFGPLIRRGRGEHRKIDDGDWIIIVWVGSKKWFMARISGVGVVGRDRVESRWFSYFFYVFHSVWLWWISHNTCCRCCHFFQTQRERVTSLGSNYACFSRQDKWRFYLFGLYTMKISLRFEVRLETEFRVSKSSKLFFVLILKFEIELSWHLVYYLIYFCYHLARQHLTKSLKLFYNFSQKSSDFVIISISILLSALRSNP